MAWDTSGLVNASRASVVVGADAGDAVDADGCVAGILAAGSSAEDEPLKVGQSLEVEVIHIDRQRCRVSLDFRRLEEDPWSAIIDNYKVGDELTGWISRYDDD